MGDVVVARVQAADKALQEVIALNIVMAGLHQTDLIMNVIGQLGARSMQTTLPFSLWTAELMSSIICLVLPVP